MFWDRWHVPVDNAEVNSGICVPLEEEGELWLFSEAERNNGHHTNILKDKQRAFTPLISYLSPTRMLKGPQYYLHFYWWVNWDSEKVEKAQRQEQPSPELSPLVFSAWTRARACSLLVSQCNFLMKSGESAVIKLALFYANRSLGGPEISPSHFLLLLQSNRFHESSSATGDMC